MILFNGDFYEGYTKDDQFNGQGMFIEYESKIVAEGMFKNSLLHGKGVEEYPDGNMYEGDFYEGQKHGQGKFTFKDGSVYEGGF
jgi:hypothetical protein